MSLSPTLEDHFRHPRHAGRVADATGRARADNPGCGDLVEIEARVEDGIVQDARFLARGCSATIAGASFVLERAHGARVDDVLAYDAGALWAEVGERNEARRHGVQLALEALQRAVRSAP